MGGGGYSGSSYMRDLPNRNNNDNCDNVSFITELQNIQPALFKHKRGDILKVDSMVNTLYVEGEHGVCGNITAMEAKALINCINKGKIFNATILDIGDMYCRVRIVSAND